MSNEARKKSQDLAEQLHSVAIHLLRRLRRADESSGLSAPRMSALSVIVFGGPIALGSLAKAEQVRPPTMTRIVNALEAQGLVVKKPDAEDGRSLRISATRAGKKLLLQGRKRRVGALTEQIEALGGAEQQTLKDAARILASVVRGI
jgi:DNA-binding MarR family transcriptional regulator